ncbi:unnamed protein product [Wickerhamomyces anomalus]
MERQAGSFVIFRFGEDNSENVILNLPSILLSNGNQTSRGDPSQASNQPAASDNAQENNQSSNNETSNRPNDTTDVGSNEENEGSTEEHIQRNMLVSVSYVYSGDGTRAGNGGNADQNGQRENNRTGSVLLNVPNIPSNRSESQLNALIEFAASIALSALAANIRRNRGIKKETFEKFPIKSKSDVKDSTCSVCFEEYEEQTKTQKDQEDLYGKEEEEKDDLPNAQRKRKRRASDEGSENGGSSPRKSRRTESVSHPNSSNGGASTSESQEADQQTRNSEEEFTHIPVELPCKHVFGRNCLYEWLKSNSTCPLCRQQVVENSDASNSPPERINIPNITSLLNPSSRDNPMVIVLDRATNTLTTRNSNSTPGINNNTPEANIATSLVSALTEPTGIPISGSSPPRRDPLSAGVLGGLNRGSYGFPGLFSSGVASRRTRSGVETVNLDNDNRETFDNNFYDESRRLIEERLRARNLRNEPSEQSHNNGSESNGSNGHDDSQDS